MKKSVIALLNIIVVATALYGFYSVGLNKLIQQISYQAIQTFFLLLIIFFTIIFLSRRLNKRAISITFGLFICITMTSQYLWSVVTVLWFIVSSYLIGDSVNRILHMKSDLSYNFLIGAGFYGTFVGLLVHLPINYPGLYAILLLAPIIFYGKELKNMGGIALNYFTKKFNYSCRQTLYIETAIFSLVLVSVIVTFMPDVEGDSLITHLFVPSQVFLRHKWGFDFEKYVFAVMPMLGDWIYTLVFMLGGEVSARLVNLWFLIVLVHLVYKLARYLNNDDYVAKLLILLFLSMPLTFTEVSSCYIDTIWTAFLVAGVIALLKDLKEDENTNLIQIGLLIGFALAAKAVTLVCILGFLYLLITQYKCVIKNWKSLIIGVGVIILIGGIPYLTAYVMTGNPVFPFFNKTFQSKFYLPINFDDGRWHAGASWDFIYQATFYSSKFIEDYISGSLSSIGYQWLLLYIPALTISIVSIDKKNLIIFICSILCFVGIFHSSSYLRYIFPVLALASANIGKVFDLKVNGGNSKKIFLILLGVILSLNLLARTYFSGGIYFAPIFSQLGRNDYLQNRLPIRNAINSLNYINYLHKPVAIFAYPQASGLASDGIYPYWYNYLFKDKIDSIKTPDELGELLIRNEVQFIILDPNWDSINKRNLIESATDNVASFNGVSIRKIKEKYRFNNELIKNSNFSNRNAEWDFSNGAKLFNGGVSVSVASPVTQKVNVTPGDEYLNTVKVSCLNKVKTLARLQINWLDSKARFITTNIVTFDCTDEPSVHSMQIVAPSKASIAQVYCSGGTDIPVVFYENSLKND